MPLAACELNYTRLAVDVAYSIYYRQLQCNYFVIKCYFITFTISIPLSLRLQVGQVGIQDHGSRKGGRLSFRRKHWTKFLQKSNVDFSVMDFGQHGSCKTGKRRNRERDSDKVAVDHSFWTYLDTAE